MTKTMAFNILAFILAVALPVATGAGYTGEVPVEFAVFVPAVIAAVNMLLKRLGQTERGEAMNI